MVSFHKKFQPVSVDGNRSSSGGKYLFTTEGLPSDRSLGTSQIGCFIKKKKVWLMPSGRGLRWFPRSSNNRAQVHNFDQSLVKDNFV